jgi:[ribosomal protein S5]-alanine N-acetyltransferase
MINFRLATSNDVSLYFDWANDEEVRRQSFQTKLIDFETHTNWFAERLGDDLCHLLVFETVNQIPVGQVRLEQRDGNDCIIGLSVDKTYRGKRLAIEMINAATGYYFALFPNSRILAYVKKDNKASLQSFLKADFEIEREDLIYSGKESIVLKKLHENRTLSN